MAPAIKFDYFKYGNMVMNSVDNLLKMHPILDLNYFLNIFIFIKYLKRLSAEQCTRFTYILKLKH